MKKIIFLLLVVIPFITSSCGGDDLRKRPQRFQKTGSVDVKDSTQSKQQTVNSVPDTSLTKEIESIKKDTVLPKELKETINPNTTSTVSTTSAANVPYVTKLNGYKSRYPEVISSILLAKRTFIMEKEGKPHDYYGDWFFDLFEIDKAPIALIQYYESKIDNFVISNAKKGNLNYQNLHKGTGKVID